jgi:hypothetical protein
VIVGVEVGEHGAQTLRGHSDGVTVPSIESRFERRPRIPQPCVDALEPDCDVGVRRGPGQRPLRQHRKLDEELLRDASAVLLSMLVEFAFVGFVGRHEPDATAARLSRAIYDPAYTALPIYAAVYTTRLGLRGAGLTRDDDPMSTETNAPPEQRERRAPSKFFSDACVQVSILWPEHDVDCMTYGVVNSAIARRLQVLFAEHAAAAQPLEHRLAAFGAIGRFLLSLLGEPHSTDDREMLFALEGVVSYVERVARGAQRDATFDSCMNRLRDGWDSERPDANAAGALLDAVDDAGAESASHAFGAWCATANLLRTIELTVAADAVEPAMQACARLAYGHLWPAAG